MNYIQLINKFHEKDSDDKFSRTEGWMYFRLLDMFNEKKWPKFLRRDTSEILGLLRVNYRTMHAARKVLIDRGLIYVKTQPGCRSAIYSLLPLPDGIDPVRSTEFNMKFYAAEGVESDNSELDETTPETATSSPTPERTTGIKKGVIRQQPSSPPPNEPYSPDGDHPPDDGIDRSWPELQRNLNELNIPPGDYQKIVQLSDYGRKGHPVWKAFHEINRRKGTKGAIERPGSWIQWYIKQAPSTATAPVTPAPSPSPEVSGIQADRPPNDGAERDWDKLKSRLKELKCTPIAINQIAILSGYGKTDNPVWNALEEIGNSGDILYPGKWIVEYIRKNTT